MRQGGKVAVVTGGSKGIGRAISLRLARDGVAVGILGRGKAAAEEVADEVRQEGGRAIAVACDVTNYDETKRAVAQVHEKFGSIDVLVNNAGIDVSKFFMDTDTALWNEIIDVNYKGFLNVTHICIPYMMEQQRGNIVSMGSDAGRVGNAGEVIYCGTKAAIMASSKALARELARFNIRVNCVSPGPVHTGLLAGLHGEEKGKQIMETVAKMIPMKRIGEPEDVAGVVAFFVSEDSRYITGQVLSVDGGLTMIS
jgi:2-hydroxycyclohexanecarboxyl-CoA dehydrogenase